MVNASVRQTFLDIAASDYAIPETIHPTEFILNAIALLGESEGKFRERNVYGTLVCPRRPENPLQRPATPCSYPVRQCPKFPALPLVSSKSERSSRRAGIAH